jgi:hypothetical protein
MFPQGLYNVPIPGMDQTYDPFYSRAFWDTKFLLWPRRCALTNRRLWLCWAYRGTAVWTGPGEPAIEYRYHTTTEHLIWKLKGN